MSLAMRRARRRYFWPNVKGWFITSLFAGAVYMYSIEAVRQDDFVRAFSSFIAHSVLAEMSAHYSG